MSKTVRVITKEICYQTREVEVNEQQLKDLISGDIDVFELDYELIETEFDGVEETSIFDGDYNQLNERVISESNKTIKSEKFIEMIELYDDLLPTNPDGLTDEENKIFDGITEIVRMKLKEDMVEDVDDWVEYFNV